VSRRLSGLVYGLLKDPLGLLAVLAVLVIAVFLRLYHLDSWPPIHIDEAISGREAIHLFDGRVRLLEPSFTHYLAAALLPLTLAFELMGPSLEAMRVVAVLYGLGAVLAVYWAGCAFFGRTAGLLAAVVLATSHVAIAMSRFGGINSQGVFLAALCFAAYGQALRSGGRWWAVWGAVIGLGAYTYEGFRIVPAVIVLGLLLAPPLLWRLRKGLLLAFVSFLVVASPVVFRFVQTPDKYVEESTRVSVLGNSQPFLDAYDTDSVHVVVREQFKKSFKYFIDGDNRDTQYGFRGPGFDSLTKALFFAGLVVAVIRIHDVGYRTILLWFWLGLLFGSAMTESPPLVPRLAMLMPAAALLAGAPLGQAIEGLRLQRGSLAAGAVAAGIAVLLFLPNYASYFEKYQAKDVFWPWVEPNRAVGAYVSRLDGGTSVYLFRTPGVWAQHPILDFVKETGRGKDTKVVDVEGWDKPDFRLPGSIKGLPAGGEARFVVTQEGQALIPWLQALCPTSRLEVVFGPLEIGGKQGLLYEVLTVPDIRCLMEPANATR